MLRVIRAGVPGTAPGPGGIGEAMPCRCRAVVGRRAPLSSRGRPGDAEGPVLSAPGRGGRSRGPTCW